jgi:hypothetical protein
VVCLPESELGTSRADADGFSHGVLSRIRGKAAFRLAVDYCSPARAGCHLHFHLSASVIQE